VIAALLPADVRLQRLRAALPDGRALVACAGWSELARECERGAAQLVVVDLYAEGAPDFERLRQLRARAPHAVLVAYVDPARARALDLFDAGRSGVEALVLRDENDAPAALAALLDRALARGAASTLRPHLGALRPVARDAVLVAVTRAHERLTPDGLARRLAVSRRLLARRLADAGLPAPHQLLTWGRLLVAAFLLEDERRSADGVAAALDFASASAFRNLCRRYLDATPREIRASGGARWVAERLFAGRGAARATDGGGEDEAMTSAIASAMPSAMGEAEELVARAGVVAEDAA
jgi:AraC-like DNA-binding protein